MIRHFHEQGHQVTVASLSRSDEETHEAQGIRDHCSEFILEQVSPASAWSRMFVRLPTPAPSSMGYFYSSRLAKRIRDSLLRKRYDLIFVHCSSVAPYVSTVAETPKILDFGDMDSQKWLIYAQVRKLPLSLGYWIEGAKLEREEKRLARQFDLCTCTTRTELNTLESYRAAAATDWFPNGVDTEYFSPTNTPYDPDTIAFIGRMDYYPNQQAMFDFCREILPLIRQKRPDANLQIIGANPSAAVERLGRLSGVTVTGSVPDVRPYVQRSALTVAPLSIARGTQNKILESMAMGVPVVASEQAAGGVDAEPDEHFQVASDPVSFCSYALRLLEHPTERDRLSKAGRQRILSRHNWSTSMAKLDNLIADCIERFRMARDAKTTTS